jgi:hypothetical protein
VIEETDASLRRELARLRLLTRLRRVFRGVGEVEQGRGDRAGLVGVSSTYMSVLC